MKCNISREKATKIALTWGKICKHEYLTLEETLSPDQCIVIGPATFAYILVSKVFEKQKETIEDQVKNK